MLKVFYSYCHRDESLRERLEIHLAMLKNAKYISDWHDRKILPGDYWDQQINSELETADIVLLLISPDFLASPYCLDIEVQRALELHRQNKLLVVPIILRFCDWQLAEFRSLQCLPKDAKPICSTHWENEDAAFLNVVEGIKKVVNVVRERKNTSASIPIPSKLRFDIGGYNYYIERYLLLNNTFIGIDFGTSTSVVSVARLDEQKNSVSIRNIPFPFESPAYGIQESELVPSVLYNDKRSGQLFSGMEAKSKKFEEKTVPGVNYWSSFKMGLGKDEGAIYTESELKGQDNGLKILNDKDATLVFLYSLKRRILDYIKQEKLSHNLKLSISIPASFEANQRRELLEVIKEVGFDDHEELFIDEPNAAFLNYIQENSAEVQFGGARSERQYTLVFDFGAGTCDISILEYGKKNQGFYSKNIAISKFEHLGGDDIDREIARQFLFMEFCEINALDPDLITSLEYEDYFEGKLKTSAEALKIKVCEKLKKSKLLITKDMTLCYDEPLILIYKGTPYTYESQSLSINQFKEIMLNFLEESGESESSIYYVINSALRKAKMQPGDIDNILMVGGSCKNPLIEASLRNHFLNAEFLIPNDLQVQVAKGAAIHSLLSQGMNKRPIAPIVSESISILLQNKKHLNIIQQGEEIPRFKSITEQLGIQANGQRTIEIPLYVSGEDKMLQNVVIHFEKGFQRQDIISISSEINQNKIVTIKVLCNNQQLDIRTFSPFANEILSPYKRAVKEVEREINNLLASGSKKSEKKVTELVDSLLLYHTSANNYKAAMETTIKYYPNRYSDISYFADCAGYNKLAREYVIKAYNSNPNDTNAFNVAQSLTPDSSDYFHYMQIAADLGNTAAKVIIAVRQIAEGKEAGRNMLFEPFDILYRKFQNDPSELNMNDLDDLILAAEYLGYDLLVEQVHIYIDKRNTIKLGNELFHEANLLKER